MDARELLNAFKAEVSKAEFENFLAPLKFNDKLSKSEHLIFNAPNELMAKFIQSKYAEKIAYFYEVQSGIKAKVSIQTNALKTNSKAFKISVNTQSSSLLNPSFTFENFVVGDSNQYAFATCKAASSKDKLGKLYNPIFIYGPTGLGKTHLLQAVGNACLELAKRVIYATAERFTKEFIAYTKEQSLEKFHEKYRNCDVLLIDDVQFFGEGEKEKTQEQFFFTFNEVKEKFGQIIMTSDKPPNVLKGITERLKSRFANGIIADITPPEFETKLAIIQKKCEFNGINLSAEIISYIATSMGDNIREIEGMITNLNAYSRLINQEITLDIAKIMMKDHIKEKKESINIDDILTVVCKEFNIKTADIKSNKKQQNIVMARRIVIFLARELTSMSMPALSKIFDMKDHTAISHNIKKINELIEKNETLKDRINELRNKILVKNQGLS